MRLFLIACCALLWCAVPARADLTFCNDSGGRAVVAIGYKGAEGWTSEGWWEVTAGECATVVPGPLPLSHYYWRGSTGEEDFPAQDYYFCTSEGAFTIVGDTDCEARGHVRERFSEIAVGGRADVTVRITGAAAPAPVADPGPGPEPQPAGEGVELGAVQQLLQGVWHDVGDDSFVMIIRENRIEDRFIGIKAGEGTFELAPTCDGADGAGPVMLVSYPDVQLLCWIILKLDEAELRYLPANRDKPVRMRRGV
ncbi:MAG: DUF1036 domain-containing protein [Roseovarius sp.]